MARGIRPHERTTRPARQWSTAGLLVVLSLCLATAAFAQRPGKRRAVPPGPAEVPPAKRQPAEPSDYGSRHFLIHTDLPAAEARDLLKQLETMLSLVASYWGQPLKGQIECYIVRDLNVWGEDALPAEARAKIAAKAGITTTETLNRGRRFISGKSVVYAIADGGTPQHEAVHAYCGQTFGNVGPLWYSEGMAELGQCWRRDEQGVFCKQHVLDYLRSQRPKGIRQIVSEDGVARRRGQPAARTGDSWQSYAWRWALCHLLANNPNYSVRFRSLGLGYLSGSRLRFAEAFGPMLDEIDFEYRFFLANIEKGFRVDLARWDWDARFREPDSTVRSRIMAQRGWQPSSVRVEQGQRYAFQTGGRWKLDADGPAVSADGAADGRGELQGVIFRDYTLGKPFRLGASGTWTAPADGELYLRCGEAWSEIADNTGFVSVKIKKAAPGPTDETTPTPAPAAASVN
ncbi:MAG: hypothetical protein DWQ37_07745 [Planctomycetota bacterium]|nr:MAG: hypothetical protein DWQ37_07745 [Planctomycetota bacterium]